MNHHKKMSFFAGLLLGISAFLPAAVIAAPASEYGSSDPSNTSTNNTGFQLVTCQGVDDPRTTAVEVTCDYNQLVGTFQRIVNFVLYIMIPIVMGMILYTGFKYLTANGDPGKLADAKRMIKPVFIGLFFILAAWLIVNNLLNYLLDEQIGDVSKSQILNGSN